MKEAKENFLKILEIEISDLKEDIKVLIEECNKDHDEEKITNYVFMENLMILRREVLGVNDFMELILNTDHEQFPTLEDLASHIRSSFKKEIKEKDLVPALERFVNRKIEKVLSYIQGKNHKIAA